MFLSAYLYLRIQYTMFFSFSQYTFADFCTCLACLRFGFAIACELYFIEDSDQRPSEETPPVAETETAAGGVVKFGHIQVS